MAVGTSRAGLPAAVPTPAAVRLGIDQPVGHWPTASRLKAYEAAGFSHVQVRMPPRQVLDDPPRLAEHATALREAVSLTGLELILHAPDDLLAGTPEHDLQLNGAITYAALAGSKLIVYHGARANIRETWVANRRVHSRDESPSGASPAGASPSGA